MHRFLARPLHWLDERTPQVAVWAERERFWAEGHSNRPLRQAFLHEVRDQVRRPRGAPEAAADRMRPLARILEIAGARPSLTQAGYLPPRMVQEFVAEFGCADHRPPRSEADAPVVMMLMAFAKEAALVRRARGKLGLTEVGRRAVADPAVLWEQVVKTLAAGNDFTYAVRELLLVRLLRGASEHGPVEQEIESVLREAGWRPSDGGELTRNMVSFKLWDAIRPMDLIGMLEVGEWPDRSLRLTEFGIESAGLPSGTAPPRPGSLSNRQRRARSAARHAPPGGGGRCLACHNRVAERRRARAGHPGAGRLRRLPAALQTARSEMRNRSSRRERRLDAAGRQLIARTAALSAATVARQDTNAGSISRSTQSNVSTASR
jgi:hypothetical protein